MSATADKARYFLEQSVPELKEYERKKIFSPTEITSISKKRSDFEHKINARGSAPSDYATYAEFEINVDTLRRKRVKRMGIKSTTHNGQRRIFFVFDRGTRKFPGDVALWMQSIEYARRQKAYKKLAQIFTNVLRLHPAKSELWIYAAQFAMEENGDMTQARSYMQRGLRFCKTTRDMWVEYTRLELTYIAKIYARRQILGIGVNTRGVDATYEEKEQEDGTLRLPSLTAQDINPDVGESHEVDETALQNLDSIPALSDAIPNAIFDAAMEQFKYDPVLAHRLFDMLMEFQDVPAARGVFDHIIEVLQMKAARSWHTHACRIAEPLIGSRPETVEFVSAIRLSLQQITTGLLQADDKRELNNWCKSWLEVQLSRDLDPAVRAVLSSKLSSLG